MPSFEKLRCASVQQLLHQLLVSRSVKFMYLWKDASDTLGDWIPYWNLFHYLRKRGVDCTFLTWFEGECDQQRAHEWCREIVKKTESAGTPSAKMMFKEDITKEDLLEIFNSTSTLVCSGEWDEYWDDRIRDAPFPRFRMSLRGDRTGTPFAEAVFSFISPVFTKRPMAQAGSFMPALNTLAPLSSSLTKFVTSAKNSGHTILGILPSMNIKNIDTVVSDLMALLSENPTLVTIVRTLKNQKSALAPLEKFGQRVCILDEYVEFGSLVPHLDIYVNTFGHGSVMWGVVFGKPQIRLESGGGFGAIAGDKKLYEKVLKQENVSPKDASSFKEAVSMILRNKNEYEGAAKRFQTRVLNEDVGASYLDGSSPSLGFQRAEELLLGQPSTST